METHFYATQFIELKSIFTYLRKKLMVVMHISDLHFGIADVSNNKHIENRKKVLETFLQNFSNLPDDLMPDVLVITGDIGYSGVDSDYQEAKNFIEKLVDSSKNKLSKFFSPINKDDMF